MLIDPLYAGLLEELWIAKRSGRLNLQQPKQQRRRHQQTRPAKIVALLEDLESGDTARALVLKKTDRPLQIVSIRGDTANTSAFKVAYKQVNTSDPFDPAHSGPISVEATPAAMQTALERIDVINPGDVRVTLGNHILDDEDKTELVTGRWLVEFLTLDNPEMLVPFEDVEASLGVGENNLITQTHNLVATTTIETINASLPMNKPLFSSTPLMAGAFVQIIVPSFQALPVPASRLETE